MQETEALHKPDLVLAVKQKNLPLEFRAIPCAHTRLGQAAGSRGVRMLGSQAVLLHDALIIKGRPVENPVEGPGVGAR